jgi:hypothetical protein
MYPVSSVQVPWLNVTFPSTAASAAGVAAGLRALGKRATVVGMAGDGGTADIGIQALSGVAERNDDVLFISGCVSNQGTFYPRFDAVVLLTAPANVILERVALRESNAFGKRDAERDRILDDLANVEPLLRAAATAEIDTRAPLGEVVDALESIADTVRRRLERS